MLVHEDLMRVSEEEVDVLFHYAAISEEEKEVGRLNVKEWKIYPCIW